MAEDVDTAIMYSSKFTNECQHSESFDPHKITLRMMLEDCNDLKREGMKNASINRYISAVSMILKFSQEMGFYLRTGQSLDLKDLARTWTHKSVMLLLRTS